MDATFIGFIFLMFMIIYFTMIRPQTKKAKEQKLFLDNLAKGDKIVTLGGIHGRIVELNPDHLLVEVDTNTKLKIEKGVVSLDFTRALLARTNNNKTSEEKESRKIQKTQKEKAL